MNGQKYCIVMSTFESEEQADKIIDQVIFMRLAACVQSLPIQSKYFWEGKVQKDTEVLVFFKTKSDLYEELKTLLMEIHPYDTPEIIKTDIADGSEGYLNWINEVTKK